MKTNRRGFLFSSAGVIAAASARGDSLPRRESWSPRLSDNLAEVSPGTLRWLKQFGCRHVVFQGTDKVDADHKGYWTIEDVRGVKKNCEEAGLILESMMIPIDFYRQARLGKPGRDKEIDNVCRTIQAAGANGIPLLEWRFWPDFFWDERAKTRAGNADVTFQSVRSAWVRASSASTRGPTSTPMIFSPLILA
jgi:D-mannonate dehydratase